MPIQHSKETERTREGGVIPRIKERDKETCNAAKVALIPIIIRVLDAIDRRFRS